MSAAVHRRAVACEDRQIRHACCRRADAQVDAAATILRMLLIKDLRGLQTQIDDMIVQVQVRGARVPSSLWAPAAPACVS